MPNKRANLRAARTQPRASTPVKSLGVEGQDPKTHPPLGLKTLRLNLRRDSRLKSRALQFIYLTPRKGVCRDFSTSRPRDATRGSFWVLRAAFPDCTVQQ